MFDTSKMSILISALWGEINKKHRKSIFILLITMVIASFSEMMSIGAVVPFLAVLMSPEKIYNYPGAGSAIQILNITKPEELLLPLTVLFSLLTVIAGLMRLLLIKLTTSISYSIGCELSLNIFRRTLYQPYHVHIDRNSSRIITAISTKIDIVIGAVIMNGLYFISNMIMMIAILVALMFVNLSVTLIIFLIYGVAYLFISKFIRLKLFLNSLKISNESTQIIKLVQDAMGGIRDILLGGHQEIYCDAYRKADHPLRKAQGLNHFISHSPKFIMESFGMIFIAFLAFKLVRYGDGILSLAIIGMMGLGAQRLLPMMQQAYSTWVGVFAAQGSLQEILVLLKQAPVNLKEEKQTILPLFTNKIELINVAFKYKSEMPYIFKGINISIEKGDNIGIIGKSGVGKTTLVDLVMGLLEPTLGEIKVDGHTLNSIGINNWQCQIAHVPQFIFLKDATIAENIAFGISPDKINNNLIDEVSKKAKIIDWVESLPNKFETLVGERGSQLSGGQRQRIGIARALYRSAKIIIFDEATSALDSNTEEQLINGIYQLDKSITTIFISHRLSILKKCNKIIEIDAGTTTTVINNQN